MPDIRTYTPRHFSSVRSLFIYLIVGRRRPPTLSIYGGQYESNPEHQHTCTESYTHTRANSHMHKACRWLVFSWTPYLGHQIAWWMYGDLSPGDLLAIDKSSASIDDYYQFIFIFAIIRIVDFRSIINIWTKLWTSVWNQLLQNFFDTNFRITIRSVYRLGTFHTHC